MKNNKRKSLIIFFIISVITLTSFNSIYAATTTTSKASIINETSSIQTITQGVTLQNVVRFRTDGWLNINILKVDLSNPYIKVDTLTSLMSVGKISSVMSLATEKGAIASVNASFFTPLTYNTGFPVGPIIQSSSLLCSSNDFNKTSNSMASFSVNNLNQALINYWKSDISIKTKTGKVIAIARYNKYSSKYDDFTVLDSKWGSTSIGATSKYPDIVEVLVENNIVTKILVSSSAMNIPANSYVINGRGNWGKTLLSNFAIGDRVSLNITTNPDWANINMSVSGGSILVKEGKIPATFSSNVSGVSARSPKTAIGSSSNGKLLYFVTVDGRQTGSIGMSEKEMAEYMLELGVYNAIDMDGGGSTTMVARQAGNNYLDVLNNPSDGLPRAISTAIGIFSSAPPSNLSELIIETEDTNIFINTSRAFTIKGVDSFSNPIVIPYGTYSWSVSGVSGYFVGNTFYPKSSGEGKITATVGNISTSKSISVLSEPVRLVLDDKTVKVPLADSRTFPLTGFNKSGYSAIINPLDVKWNFVGGAGRFIRHRFYGTALGTGYVEARIGNAAAYCSVSVSADNIVVKDNFDTLNGSFTSYPSSVKGSYNMSDEQLQAGISSGKLTYDFNDNINVTRAAYLSFSNNGITIDPGIYKFGVWVYNDHPNTNSLKAEIYDSKGAKHLIDLAKTLDWTGWDYIEVPIENIPLPAQLTKLYLVQINPVAESGSVYFEDITFKSNTYPTIDESKTPKNTTPIDSDNIVASFDKATSTSFRFGVFGQSRAPSNAVEQKLITSFTQKINNVIDSAVIVGTGSHESVSNLIKYKTVIATNTVDLKSTKAIDYKYSYTDIKNSRFFKLDLRNKGLRLSDSSQWQKFKSDLNAFKGSNVFVLLSDSQEHFTDKLEMKLFKDTLTDYKKKSGKNVWVFYKGDKDESYMDRGIKYISTSGYETKEIEPKSENIAQYVLVTVKGSVVTYTFRPII